VNKKSGSSTVLSPEIRLSLPRAGEALTLSDISTMAPGGVVFSKTGLGGAGGSGAYLLYHADIPIYSNLPSENTMTHKAAAGYIYNGNRVSIGVSDEFVRSYDETLTGIQASPLAVDKFKSNLLDVYGSYDTGNRFKLMIDYSHFLVDYDAAGTGFRNLGDDSVAGYVFYKIRPKTSLFVEYDFIDISHTDDSALDSREHNISVGIQWDLTAKSKGVVSAGYGIKDMAGQGGSFKNYIFQAQISHQLTSKNDITFSAYRMTEETDYLQTLFLVSTGIKADYNHRLTTKISASAGLGYERDDYEGAFSFGGVTKQRRDTAYDADLSLRYEFKRWLKADIGYTFRRMNSNFGQFEYSSNTLFIRLMTAI
jgi:polysaccharide biosynthesis protein VpsM